MTMDPNPLPPAEGSAADALDETQPLDVSRFAPTPDPRPDTRWAWAAPESRPAGSGWVASTPASSTPAGAAPSAWSAPASSSTASWSSVSVGGGAGSTAGGGQAVVWATPLSAVVPAPAHRRSGPGIGTIVTVALLAAVLGSAGTVMALQRSGAFDTPAPAAAGTGGGLVSGNTAAGGPGFSGDDSAAVISASAKVSPAVVKITTGTASGTGDPFASGQADGVGSGIIFNAGGWIITNHHVVIGTDTINVELKDGRKFTGTVYGIDTLTDLAIVKVDATGLPTASLGTSDALKVGQLVVAVGSPLGTYSFSVTSGIVSGKGRSVVVSDGTTTGGTTVSNLIQTDAAINAGNSGGPLADSDGNVVGINTISADGSSGIGFAIPIDIAKPIMSQAVKGQKLERPYIGIMFQPITPKVKQANRLTVDNGALVGNTSGSGSAVKSGSPAEAAGIMDGDVITAINGIALDQEHPLNLVLVQFAPGDTVTLTVLRGGQTMQVPVTLAVRPANLN